MIILIGANGFLGRHTAELLERQGTPAIAVSRNPDREFFRRFTPSLQIMNAADFASSAGDDAIAAADAIIYLVCQSVPSTFVDEPWRELPENVQPALEFFHRVARISLKPKIVLLSSGGTIYGSDGMAPQSETAPTRPISGYGLGKLLAEEGLRFVGRTRKTRYAILRVSNPVGRWQTDARQGIVGVALRAARDGAAIRLFGGGTQIRDFVDADDVAEAILRAAIDRTHDAATWNIGSGIGVSVVDMLGRVSRAIGRPVAIEHAPARAIDVQHVVLDCQKVAGDLGWTAKTPLEHSIASLWKVVSNQTELKG